MFPFIYTLNSYEEWPVKLVGRHHRAERIFVALGPRFWIVDRHHLISSYLKRESNYGNYGKRCVSFRAFAVLAAPPLIEVRIKDLFTFSFFFSPHLIVFFFCDLICCSAGTPVTFHAQKYLAFVLFNINELNNKSTCYPFFLDIEIIYAANQKQRLQLKLAVEWLLNIYPNIMTL